ncbi:Uncharacterized [Moorella glycerini]|uniref:O-antigen ligase domain-containing protein n=1 Tax=Neomoorella stamsii TaxID=1266720 RepID=A0A9X7P7D9_9FIRM|nr:hypothetical protein MOST_03410 [Moorella stamsii]CEP68820.1 Uncharacterized [Moorella glycerini]
MGWWATTSPNQTAKTVVVVLLVIVMLFSLRSISKAVIVIVLLVTTIPSLATKRIFAGELLGSNYDFDFSLIVPLAILGLLYFRVVRRGRVFFSPVTRTFMVVWALATVNAFLQITTNPQAIIPVIRGLVNLSFYMIAVFLLSYLLNMRLLSPNLLASSIILYGEIMAYSAIGDYALALLNPKMHLLFRSLVWGTDIGTVEALRLGGTTYVGSDFLRVGGLVGAPENLGMILALTLPFTYFVRPMNKGIRLLVIYCVVAAVSGSRSLIIAIAIFLMFQAVHRLPKYNLPRNLATYLVLGISVVSMLLTLNSRWLSRLGADAWFYEFTWRYTRLSDVLKTTLNNAYAPLLGLGLGPGVEELYGLKPLSSGILLGDFATAYALGGVVGIMILLIIIRVTMRLLTDQKGARQNAMNFLVPFAGALALFMPVLTMIFLVHNPQGILLIALLVTVEYYSHPRDSKTGSDNEYAPKAERRHTVNPCLSRGETP